MQLQRHRSACLAATSGGGKQEEGVRGVWGHVMRMSRSYQNVARQ